MDKICIWTKNNLDGVGSVLAFKWYLSEKYLINYEDTSTASLRDHFKKWMLTNTISSYKYVYFIGLDIYKILDLIDYDNVVIINHNKYKEYPKKARVFVEEDKASCLIIYKLLKKVTKTDLSEPQKALLALINDQEMFLDTSPISKKMRIIYWNTQNKFNASIDEYKKGFKGFSDNQLGTYSLYITNLNHVLKNLQLFGGKYQNSEVISTFENKYIFEAVDYILQEFPYCDFVIVVNMDQKHVTFKKRECSDLDMSEIASKLCGGRGHKHSAGGEFTATFLEFTKTLKPIL